MPKLLDLSDSDDNSKLKINTNYAEGYNNWRKKEELQKFKDRYGDKAKFDFDVSNEDTSTSEDDEHAEEITEEFEKNFYKTLSYLKNKDPKIYDSQMKFFSELESSNENTNSSKKKEKPLFLRDYERELILNQNGQFVDEDDKPKTSRTPTIVEKAMALKESFKKIVMESDEESENTLGGFLVKKEKTSEEIEKEEADYIEWLKGRKKDLEDNESKTALKPLHDYWNDPNLDSKETFLKDYLLNKKFLEENENEETDDEDEEEQTILDKQEEFEHKYNFRFEEPDAEFIKRYPRTMENSLRKKDNKRKLQRENYKQRKEQEKAQKKEELKQLKAIKRKEIMDKIEQLKEITGNEDVGFQENDFEGDFDPDAHDKRMKELFNDEFYQTPEDEQKPEFNEIDEQLEIENWDKWNGEKNIDDDEYSDDDTNARDTTVPFCEDPNFNMDCDYDPNSNNVQDELIENSKDKKKKKRKKSKLKKALLNEKPVFNPEGDKSFEEYFDEYYKLDYEDIIGDMPCRFKYRQVQPNDFGLTIDEILNATDRELNKWCSLKKAVQYRDEKSELYDLHVFKRKAQNINLKKKIFTSLYQKNTNEEKNQETSNSHVKSKKRKRSKNKKLSIEEGNKISDKIENPEKKIKLERVVEKAESNKLASEIKLEERPLNVETKEEVKNQNSINNKMNQKNKWKNKQNSKKLKSLNQNNKILNKLEESEKITFKSDNQNKSSDNFENPGKNIKLESVNKKSEIKLEEKLSTEEKKEEIKNKNINKKMNQKKKQHLKNKPNSKNLQPVDHNKIILNKLDESERLQFTLSDNRLKAYGFNPKKFRNKIKFKPQSK